MKDVRITVIKTTYNSELAAQYGVEGLPACPLHSPGQVFISNQGGKPHGLCTEAWAAFERYVFALSSGSTGFWPDWISVPGISINSCNDGLRPVIFKLEALDDCR